VTQSGTTFGSRSTATRRISCSSRSPGTTWGDGCRIDAERLADSDWYREWPDRLDNDDQDADLEPLDLHGHDTVG
jgi:hypothetical protein